MNEHLKKLRAALAGKLAERATLATTITEFRAIVEAQTDDPSDEQVAELRGHVEGRDALDVDIEDLRQQVTELEAEIRGNEAAAELLRGIPATERTHEPGRVIREERTYSAEKSARGEASFFADSFRAMNMGDFEARQRLERHGAEVRAEGEMTERATTTASYGSLVVPQYLLDQAAPLARAGRPTANIVQRLPLPAQGMSIVIPRGTTGASEAVQATQNTAVSSTDQVWTDLTVPVVTVAGQQDVSRQSLERGYPGLDELVYLDLAGAYAVALDAQVLAGTGTSGQMLGILNTAGINQATAFGAAATPATYYTKVAGQVNAIETTRFMAPNAIVMHPRRWNWLVSQLDSSGRPFVVPQVNGPMNALGVFEVPIDTVSAVPVGQFQGLPVITDASVPTAVGTGPEDQTIVLRREDSLLWEDTANAGLPKQLRFEQTLGGALTVKLVAYNYAAFTAGRYPTSVGVVGGNAGTAGFGTVAPTF